MCFFSPLTPFENSKSHTNILLNGHTTRPVLYSKRFPIESIFSRWQKLKKKNLVVKKTFISGEHYTEIQKIMTESAIRYVFHVSVKSGFFLAWSVSFCKTVVIIIFASQQTFLNSPSIFNSSTSTLVLRIAFFKVIVNCRFWVQINHNSQITSFFLGLNAPK